MSLRIDWSRIPKETTTRIATEDDPMSGVKAGDEILNPVTKTLGFATMGIGIGVINDDTVDEFAARLDLWQTIHGALLYGPQEPLKVWLATWDGEDHADAFVGATEDEALSWLRGQYGPEDLVDVPNEDLVVYLVGDTAEGDEGSAPFTLEEREIDQGMGPVRITKDDVIAHKGLSTNVFPYETRTKWLKRTTQYLDQFAGVTEPKAAQVRP